MGHDDVNEQKPNLMSMFGAKQKPDDQGIPANNIVQQIPDSFYNNPVLIQLEKRVINETNAVFIQKIVNQADLKKHIENIVDTICERDFQGVSKKDRSMVVQSLIDEFTGFGPLQRLILDETVSEIMVNGPKQIYVEQKGKLTLTNIKFRDNEHVMQIIDKIVSPLGRRIDESSPMVCQIT